MARPSRHGEEAARRQALREAAEWFAEWQAGDAREEPWRAWLAEGEFNRWAWERMEALSQRLGGDLNESGRRAAIEVIGQAWQRRRGRRHLLSGLAGLAMVAVLIGSLWQPSSVARWVAHWNADYHTGSGEIAYFELDDGTRVWLNGASALNVDYRDEARRLVLLAGEVLVDTGEDPRRPLYLDTERARLTPLGTRFGVSDREGEEVLTVFAGAVELRLQGRDVGSGAHAVIEAGRQARYTAQDVGTIGEAEGAREAWARGILLAENMRLEDFAAELDRHYRGRIRVDPAVADLTLMGAYPLQDPARSLRMVETTLPVKVRRVLPGWIRLEALERSRE